MKLLENGMRLEKMGSILEMDPKTTGNGSVFGSFGGIAQFRKAAYDGNHDFYWGWKGKKHQQSRFHLIRHGERTWDIG